MKNPCFSSLAAAALGLSLAALTGCTNLPFHPKPKPQPHPHPSAACTITDHGNPIPSHFTGTVGTTHKAHAANHVVLVQSVDTGCCAQFDRIVFNIEGLHEPTYTIKYKQPPFSECGSGMNVPVSGHAWLDIRFKVAQTHTDAGQATVPNRINVNCSNLRRIDKLCDFESDVELVVSLDAKKPYRVVEIQDPTKLIIDIKH